MEVPFPRMSLVRQAIVSRPLADPASSIQGQIARMAPDLPVRPGATVAVGCSSRGIANYAEIVAAVVRQLQAEGYRPFLFPAMGSHGAATAEGQAQVLARAGICEASMGCPIVSSMELQDLGTLPTGMPVAMDRSAFQADAFVVVNRVKSHTEFTHPFQSGLMKMMAIGMGKDFGATVYHRHFFRHGYGATIQAIAERVMGTRPLLFGVGIVEDGRAQTSEVRVVPAFRLMEEECELLALAQSMAPRLPFDDLDVLVIDTMGKDISGSGFDTKVVGRLSMPLVGPDPECPRIKRIVVCDLTGFSQGNADGVGIADFITERLYRKIDLKVLYVNALAGSEPEHARIPVVLPSDREAVAAGIATIGPVRAETLRLVRIANTRDLEYLEASTALLAECAGRTDLEVLGGTHPLAFAADGSLAPLGGGRGAGVGEPDAWHPEVRPESSAASRPDPCPGRRSPLD